MTSKPQTTTVKIEVELPPADATEFAHWVTDMAKIMVAGMAKGYSPDLSEFVGSMVDHRQYWQACEAVAKIVRGLNKLEHGQTRGAREDLNKAALALYTTLREFGKEEAGYPSC